MSGGRNKQSFIPKPVYRDHPGQNVPGAYPDTPKVSPEDSSHKKPSSFKDEAHQNHLGHEYRSAKKVDFSTSEQPSGAREGVASLPGSNDAEDATVFPGERKPVEGRRHVSAGSGDNNYRAIGELYGSQTLDYVNPIPPPINCKSPDPLPMIIGDADDLQHQNPIPPPHGISSNNDYQSSFITTGKGAPASQSRESLSTSKGCPPLTTSEYDLYGEHLDTDQFVYDDDGTAESDTPHLMFLKNRKKKVGMNKGGPKTSSPLAGNAPERRGTAVGCDGVEYYTDGKDGILPGYPTPRGVNTLIANRINDDLQNLQDNPGTEDDQSKLNHMIHGESTTSNKAVSGSHSSVASENDQYIDDNGMLVDDPANDNRIIEEKRDALREAPMNVSPSEDQKAVQPQGRHYVVASQKFPFPEASPDKNEDIETTNRNIEEQREIPIFRDGGDTATGKFEALYAPVTGKPEEVRERPVFPDGSETAAGKYEGTFVPEDFPALPSDGPGGFTYAQGKGTDGRNPQERREEPIFRDGTDAAAGKFEAKFIPVTGQPEEVVERPIFNNPKRDTAAGRYEATFVPEGFPSEPQVLSNGQEALTTTGQGPTDVVDELPDEMRDPRERREVPIFSGGGDTAAGKFEAVFEAEDGQSWEPNRGSSLYQMKGSAYRAGNEPLAKSKNKPAFNSRTESELRGSASYLGKPISKAEEEAQVERARSMARRKAGIN